MKSHAPTKDTVPTFFLVNRAHDQLQLPSLVSLAQNKNNSEGKAHADEVETVSLNSNGCFNERLILILKSSCLGTRKRTKSSAYNNILGRSGHQEGALAYPCGLLPLSWH
jgi:hypothetical protein